MYYYSSNSIEKKISEMNIDILNQLKATTDKCLLRKVDNFVINNFIEINKNYDIRFLFDNPVEGNQLLVYENYNLLREIVVTNELVHSIHIYYMKDNIILSSDGLTYLDLHSKEEKLDQYYWLDRFSKYDLPFMWIETHRIHNGGNEKDVITMVRTYPFLSTSQTRKGIIAVDIDEEIIYKFIKEIAPRNFNDLFIIDQMGKIISHNRSDFLYKDISKQKYVKDILTSPLKSGYFTCEIDNVPFVVSYTTSEYNNWKYVITVPVSNINNVSIVIKWFTVIVFLIITSLGNLFTFILSKNFYSPIKSLFIFSKSVLPANTAKNEFDVINSAMGTMRNKMLNYEHVLDENIPVLKHHFIMELMENKISNWNDVDENLSMLGMSFKHNNFCIMTLRLTYNKPISLEDRKLFEYNITNFMENYETLSVKAYATESGKDQISAIFNAQSPNRELINQSIHFLLKEINRNKTVRYTVGIGDFTSHLLDVHISYVQSLKCLKYQFIDGYNVLYYYKDIALRDTLNSGFDESGLCNIGKYIKSYDKIHLKELLDRYKTALKDTNFSYDYVQSILLKILTNIFGTIQEINLYVDKIFPERNNLYSILKASNNIDEVFSWIFAITDELFEYLGVISSNRNNELVQSIINYIDKNIDKDISLDDIASALFLSKYYVSKLFKKEIGINYVDFIIDKKLEKASELLLSKKYKVTDVCNQIGYSNVQYFIKKFKEKYGITPKQYQKEFKCRSL